MSQALEQFQTVLRLEPGNAKAREFISRIEENNAYRGAP